MRKALALAVIVTAGAFCGCSRINSEKDNVLSAIYRTEAIARSYEYEETRVGTGALPPIMVRGSIADDYRYHADAYLERYHLLGVIVADDARALRFGRHPRFDLLDPAIRAAAARGVEVPPEGNALLVANRGRWVVDRRGANDLWYGGPTRVQVGADPVHDSLGVLRYARQAVGEAAFVAKFNPESQDYRPKFDPFPPPSRDEIRYDLLAPTLTPRDPTTSTGQQLQIPGPRFFRRMSVYVRDGMVVAARESIDVASTLRDPRSHLAARIGDYDIKLPDGPVRKQAEFLVGQLSGAAQRLDVEPLREREMTVTFKNLGRRQTVVLPTDATAGRLKGILDYGQVLFERTG